ncbi:threonine/serine exporter ThrE family protein [Streptomyces sp. NPDC048330]|uniref:threonine/serine ThrE exporter family protein n=1 Tax=Streptomyces sp. NPDC048330 TaxID=3365533 RepID=UPI00371F6A72
MPERAEKHRGSGREHEGTGHQGAVSGRLLGGEAWLDRMRHALWRHRAVGLRDPSRGGSLNRARHVSQVLEFALDLGELLLSSGQGAEDVEAAMLGVTRAYGLPRCDPQVTFTMLSLSYLPDEEQGFQTATRTARRRAANHSRLQDAHRLLASVVAGTVNAAAARARLDQIRTAPSPYPGWSAPLAAGALAASASLLVGGHWSLLAIVGFGTAFCAAALGDLLAIWLGRAGVPEFYQFIAGAVPASASGVLLAAAGAGLQGSFVITGGLYALLPGRALVAGVEDGLTTFYLTASARLLEVGYLVTGIVLGVLVVLPAGNYLGAELRPEESFGRDSLPVLQLLAAALVSAALAVLLQCPPKILLLVTVNGTSGWAVFGVLTARGALSPVAATGAAAILIGLFGQLLARRRGTTSLLYVTAALGPLLPGSAVYLGILAFIQGRTDQGLAELSRAVALALALAVGVHAGREMARLAERVPVYTVRPRDAAQQTRGY